MKKEKIMGIVKKMCISLHLYLLGGSKYDYLEAIWEVLSNIYSEKKLMELDIYDDIKKEVFRFYNNVNSEQAQSYYRILKRAIDYAYYDKIDRLKLTICGNNGEIETWDAKSDYYEEEAK